MSRQILAATVARFAVRLTALFGACGITALIVVVHAADLTSLGGQGVTSSAAVHPASQIASIR
jgi:hypothetical protein